jgi:L-threonylcarbamoyladenylate synthase
LRPSFEKILRRIDGDNPQPEIISEAAAIIKSGGVIAFPTHSLYGLGADAFNSNAVKRVFELKQRPAAKPILVLIEDLRQLDGLVKFVSPDAARMMKKFWPGRLTLVFEARNGLPANLTAGTGKIGVRLAGQAVARALVQAVQGPITGTSANLTRHGGCSRIEDMDPMISRRLDLLLDAGALQGGKGSTVVDVAGNNPKILREGEVPAGEILMLGD